MTLLPLSLDDIVALPWRIVIGIASAPAAMVGKFIGKTRKLTEQLEAEKKRIEEKKNEKEEGGE